MTDFWQGKRVLVTGAAGFLGSHLTPMLQGVGAEVIAPRSTDCDLRDTDQTRRLYKTAGPLDMVFHLAATVGGIGANRQRPADFFYENTMMNCNVAHYARVYEVGKLVAVGTVCFTGDAFVQIGNEYKNISDVDTGVLTEGVIGSLVNHTLNRSYSGQVFQVKPFSCETLTVTPEHPFLTIEKGGERASVQWKAAKDLLPSDYLLIRIPCHSVDSISSVKLLDVMHVDWRAGNSYNVDTNAVIPSELIIDEDLAWFLGMFVAEGTVSKNHTHIYMSFGDEPELIDKVIGIIESKFNLKTTLRKMPNQEGYQLSFYGKKLGNWLQDACYLHGQRGARAKKVPDVLFRCQDKILIAFLRGCFQGDGCVAFRPYVNGDAINTVLYSSISRVLIYQLKTILLWFKCLGSIHSSIASPSSINGRVIKGGKHYSLKFSGKNVDTLVRLIYPDLVGSLYQGERVRTKELSWFQDMVAVPIWNIKSTTVENMDVYNLETTDHTYTANSVIVHNCAYPKYTTTPFREENLWDGYPEETNAAYGIAKRAFLVYLQALRQQYGFNGIYLIPTNLYGPRDSSNLATSHVIPALIRKIDDAQRAGLDTVEVWGTGGASRDFLYVADCAEALTLAAYRYNRGEPVNLGSGEEICINGLVEVLKAIMGFGGRIVYDPRYPDGQPRRVLNTSRAWDEFGWKASTKLEDGLRKTVEWWRANRT